MPRTVAMMQPYWFPYFGYFQLIAGADAFVLGDNLQYVHPGWVNRNRLLSCGAPSLFTLPLKKDRSDLAINRRELSDSAPQVLSKLLKTIAMSYSRAPYRDDVLALLEPLMTCPERNLALYLEYSLRKVCEYLQIDTPIHVASTLPVDERLVLDKQDRVVKLARHFGAQRYLNPIGGTALYDEGYFARHDLELRFHRMDELCYTQFKDPFVPNLSIIDVLMFNPVSRIRQWLPCYSTLKPSAAQDTRRVATSPSVHAIEMRS